MQKLIYAATFTFMLVSSIPSAYAGGSSRSDAKVPHILESGAYPNSASTPYATHHFTIHVQGKSLSELSIDLPEYVSILQGIEVTNQSGQKIDAKVSVNNRIATIVFSKSVQPDTTLSIEMKGVNTLGIDNTWHYRVYGKMVGINEEIPLGTARIQTYR